MTVWTAEQTSAIALRHRRLLVSAAAGSGKTAVLTERIVQRISDPPSGKRSAVFKTTSRSCTAPFFEPRSMSLAVISALM